MRRRAFLALTAGAAALAGLQGSAQPVAPQGLLSDWRWRSDAPRFGGFSGIEVMAGGRDFVALSDRGAFVRGRFDRDTTGTITGIQTGEVMLLKAQGDTPLRAGRTDSEGLALAPDGTAYVSFEGPARVLRYARLGGSAENLPSPREFGQLQRNSALEALAIGPDGALYTLPERSGDEGRPFPVWRFRAGRWDQPFAIPRLGSYLPVSADFGPDGRLYIGERQFAGLAGFSTRLRRFRLRSDTVDEGETVLQTPIGLHENLEGLAIWADAKSTIATMVSDDNFSFLLSTRIVEYRLPA